MTGSDVEAQKERLRNQNRAVRETLNASLEEIDPAGASASMSIDMPLQFCHTGDGVQGGFVAAMLDITMYHAVAAYYESLQRMPTLELKVSYMAASRAGKFIARARVVKAGRSIVFIEAPLYDSNGNLMATAASTAKVTNLP